jgi:hypothetical protein
MAVAPLSEMRRLRRRYTDRLLTLLAVLLALYMFVFAPLHGDLFIFHGFAIVALLGIMTHSERYLTASVAEFGRISQGAVWAFRNGVAAFSEFARLYCFPRKPADERPRHRMRVLAWQYCRRFEPHELTKSGW